MCPACIEPCFHSLHCLLPPPPPPPTALDSSSVWMPTAVRQRSGARDIWLQHMDHSSQFFHTFKPFLPHALSCLPVRGVPPGLTSRGDDSQGLEICTGTLVATGCQRCLTAQVNRSGGSPGHTPADLKAAQRQTKRRWLCAGITDVDASMGLLLKELSHIT